MPGYVPGFMVINDSDYQRVHMHNVAAEFIFLTMVWGHSPLPPSIRS